MSTKRVKTTCDYRIFGIMCDLDDYLSQESNDRKESRNNEFTLDYNNQSDQMCQQANKTNQMIDGVSGVKAHEISYYLPYQKVHRIKT